MSRFRHLSPWYWVVLVTLLVTGALSVANQLLGWEQKWIMFAVPIVFIAASIFTFRMLWKQTDHPAFHRDNSGSDETPSS